MRDSQKRPIEWKYIERLYRSKTSDIASHKLTKRHIEWKASAMKVSLATETLSNSVAESIEKLAVAGVDQFENSEGTVEFIKRVNKSFDIFNSDQYTENNLFKSPITADTKETIFQFHGGHDRVYERPNFEWKKYHKS